MKVLLLGDVHGSKDWVSKAVEFAKANDCPAIIQLGDFGYWPHMADGPEFTDHVDRECIDNDLLFYWLDGNHENHDALEELTDEHGYDSPIAIGERLFYLPRGYAWTWSRVRFIAVGGAYSIDKAWRTPGMSWWEGETITDEDVARANERGPVDILLSHDAPVGVTPWAHDGTPDRKKDVYPASLVNRKQLTRVVDALRPRFVFHGHYHNAYVEYMADVPYTTEVRGLSCDGDYPGLFFLLDLDRYA